MTRSRSPRPRTAARCRVRWVSDPVTCQPLIKSVKVKSGELASFGTMITAVQKAGYTATNRKYLMFADAAVLCGVGHLILDDRATGNANDGGNAMYARVDTGCWQAGAGGSIAAHELMHNLGGVQGSAGHSTPYGHCDDDKDLMCYADGPGVTMRPGLPGSQRAAVRLQAGRLLRHQPRSRLLPGDQVEHCPVLVPRRRGTDAAGRPRGPDATPHGCGRRTRRRSAPVCRPAWPRPARPQAPTHGRWTRPAA